MTYKQFYRTTDLAHPQVHVEVTSEVHIQDGKQNCAAISIGNFAAMDAMLPQFEPRPDRHVGREVVPPDGEFSALGRSIIGSGKAVVYLFLSEQDRDAFCETTGAITATGYLQTLT